MPLPYGLGELVWGGDGGYLPFFGGVNLGSGSASCGIYGWMSLPLISHTPSIKHFLFCPSHVSRTFFCPYCPHPACDTSILISFLLWDP